MDVDQRRALATHRRRVLSGFAEWLADALGTTPRDTALYERALTHGSQDASNYQRLEFLGDRVLGLVVADWLYGAYPLAPEGDLSRRFNTLVTGAVCADVARGIGVGPHLRLGKQARDDGGAHSENILGDVVEALIGALYLDHGVAAASAFIRRHWAARVEGHATAPSHPKSALQEWAAANQRRAPTYALVERSGPHHAPRFTVTASLGAAHEATATGASKQEAETAAATALLAALS